MKVLVLDTNLLLHGKFITEIRWRSIFEDQEVIILITSTVLKEIDDLKYSNNIKLKKRARKLISFFKKYDKNEELQNRIPLVISYRKIHWKAIPSRYRNLLDENETDHHILAEIIIKYSNDLDNVFLITADYALLKYALEIGIKGIDWMEDEKYKEIFASEDKKEKTPSLPDLGVYFDDQLTKEFSLQEISEKPDLLTIDELLEENFEYDFEDDLKYDVKEEIEDFIDLYNKQLEQINNHQEINLILRNNCNHPYNDIEIYINTILENDFILTIGELIKRPVKPKIPEYDGDGSLEKLRKELQEGIYLRGTEKIVRMHNLKLNMHISSKNKGKHTEWEVIYHIDRIKHNTIIDLHPLLIFLPDSYQTDRIKLKIAYSHKEPGTIKEQKRIIYLHKVKNV